jgi:transposase
MEKTYRRWEPDQSWLLPPSPRDWMPEGHLVYFLLDVVDQIDLSAIRGYYERESRGQPPYHPTMMVCLLLYAYAKGIFSSRKMMAACQEQIPFRVIVSEAVPDFRTISDFRKIHLAALEGLFVEVLRLCAAAGLVKVGTIALDGTKIKANASRHKAMSYQRMQEEEKRLRREIRGLLAQAEATDAEEDARHGDRRGDELPEELARRRDRLKRIREAKTALEAEAKAKAAAEAAAKQQASAAKSATPDPKAQRNFTDPESKIMKVSNKGWEQCGNAQATANTQQIILAADVTAEPNDKRQVEPMIQQTRQNLKAAKVKERVKRGLMDSGYYSEANVRCLEKQKVEPFIATERLKHHEEAGVTPRGRAPQELSPKQRMARKLRTRQGKTIYAKRKGIIEPIFGQIKQVRGFRQFLLRGLAKIRAEWRLVCLTHNLLKLHREVVSVSG